MGEIFWIFLSYYAPFLVYYVILGQKWRNFDHFSLIWPVIGYYDHFNLVFIHQNHSWGCSNWLVKYFEFFCHIMPHFWRMTSFWAENTSFCPFSLIWPVIGYFEHFNLVYVLPRYCMKDDISYTVCALEPQIGDYTRQIKVRDYTIMYYSNLLGTHQIWTIRYYSYSYQL